MSICDEMKQITRRQFFSQSGIALGTLALASLLNDRLWAAGAPAAQSIGLAGFPNFAPTAKRIIYLFQSGAPSQLDLFDEKPKLRELTDQPMPESVTKGQRIAQLRGQQLVIVGSKFQFAKHGQSGATMSELLPHTAKIVDDIALIRTVNTEAINHDPAITFIQTGSEQSGRPSMGAWISYGLGSANQDLPAFVVLMSGGKSGDQPLFTRLWGNGFLPGNYQGVRFRTSGDPVLYIDDPPGVTRRTRRQLLDAMRTLNEIRFKGVGDPEIETRIDAYEMAYRMQASVPELMDISKEPKHILDLYGATPQGGSFANNCLLARRMAERGVRFIQLYHRDWDHHTGLPKKIVEKCRETDQASAALIQDLKQRDMLKDTLVIWGGEFGRTPMRQGGNRNDYGRDHHNKAFTLWMAGGGIKPGITLGTTDDLGYNSVEDPVHVHDLQATILHCMGIDHKKLTYRFQGRDFRLTDVHGNVVKKLLA
jgi:hypothetical protein